MENSNFTNSSNNGAFFMGNMNANSVGVDKNSSMNDLNLGNNMRGNNCSFLNSNMNGSSGQGFNSLNRNEECIDLLVNQMESSFSINTNIIKNVKGLLENSNVEDKIKGIRLVYASLHYKFKNSTDYKRNLLNRGCTMLNANTNNNELEGVVDETGENPSQRGQNESNVNYSFGQNSNYGNNGTTMNSGGTVHVGNMNATVGGTNNNLLNNNMNRFTNDPNGKIDLKTLHALIFDSTYKTIADVDEYFDLLDKCEMNSYIIDINLGDVLELEILKIMKTHMDNYVFIHEEILLETFTLLIITFACCGGSDKVKPALVDELFNSVIELLKKILDKRRTQNILIPQMAIAFCRILINNDTVKLKNGILVDKILIDLLLRHIENVPNLNGVRVCYTIVIHGLKGFYVPNCQMYEKPPVRELERITNYLSICIKMSDERVLYLTSSTCITICESQLGIDVLLKTDILHNAVMLCESPNADLAFEALSIISKIAYAANHQQICILISCNVITALRKILENVKIKPGARARACNALGNIGCETAAEVELLINYDVFPLLVDIFQTDNDFNTKIEAAYAVCACLSKANQKQVGYIISCTATANRLGQNICMQLIADMLELVSESDPTNNGSVKLCKSILRGLENILDKGDDESRDLSLWENPYVFMFREVQGDIKLLQMQFFPEYTVVNKTYDILSKYFSLTSTWNKRK